jgi:hypothetical protein
MVKEEHPWGQTSKAKGFILLKAGLILLKVVLRVRSVRGVANKDD